MLSLVKIGNLKLGLIKDGRPIQTERILVTKASKDGEENFKILNGFNEDGEEKVRITLPFNNKDLNFEINFVGFLEIYNISYIAKSSGIGQDLILYPLDEHLNRPNINVGKLTEDLIIEYNLEKTGFLKCMLDGVSGFGEVFYFKTKSINSIKSINDQLTMLSALTKGRLMGIPLELKPVKKDINDETSITHLSISFTGTLSELGEIISNSDLNAVDCEAYEKMYVDSRDSAEVISLNEAKLTENFSMKILRDTESEIKYIENSAKNVQSDERIFIENLMKENELVIEAVPMATLVSLFNTMGGQDKASEFLEFIKDDVNLPKIFAKIKEISSSQ